MSLGLLRRTGTSRNSIDWFIPQPPDTAGNCWRSRWNTLYIHTGSGTFSGDLSDWRNGNAYQDDHYIQFRPFQMNGYNRGWSGNTLPQISFS